MMRELIITYNKKDFNIEYMRGTGPGGQHRNKTSSKARITHIPTGLASKCDETRDQRRNKKIAFRKLAKKIELYHKKMLQEENFKEKETRTVRTYHKVENRVKNHNTGFMQRYDEVMNDISGMLDDNRKYILEQTNLHRGDI